MSDKEKALLLLGGMGKKPMEGDIDEEPEGEEDKGLDAADALRDMYDAMKSGDFDRAASALEAAMTACGD